MAAVALRPCPVDEAAFVRLTLAHLRRLRKVIKARPFRRYLAAEARRVIRREQRALVCIRRRRRERGVRL